MWYRNEFFKDVIYFDLGNNVKSELGIFIVCYSLENITFALCGRKYYYIVSESDVSESVKESVQAFISSPFFEMDLEEWCRENKVTWLLELMRKGSKK